MIPGNQKTMLQRGGNIDKMSEFVGKGKFCSGHVEFETSQGEIQAEYVDLGVTGKEMVIKPIGGY